MMKEFEEKLESLIDGELSEAEMKQIEAEIGRNRKLKQEYDLRIFVDEALKDTQMTEFRNNLKSIARETRNRRIPLLMPVRRKWYLAAASVSIALVSGLSALFLLKMPTAPEDVYKSYYQVAKPIKIVRSVADNPGDTFNRDMQLYATGNYAEASRRLLRYTTNPAARFYAAMSLMETSQYREAETLLRTIANDSADLFSDQAEWYLGLCLLMNQNKQEAIIRFERISGSQNLYNDKAAEILRKLN